MSIQICIATVYFGPYWIFCVSFCFHACQITNQIIYQKTKILYFFWVTAFEFKISTLLNLNNNAKHDLKFQYFRCVLVHEHIHVCNNGKSFYGSTIKNTWFLHTLTSIKVHIHKLKYKFRLYLKRNDPYELQFA